jgi:DNA polymerase-3 subunit alpha (Gram-positive type)
MDLMDILQKIGLDGESLAYFSDAFLMRPKTRQSGTVQITIRTAKVLPSRVYRSTRRCFQQYLGTDVQLVIQPDDHQADNELIFGYVSLFAQEDHFECPLPVVQQQRIMIPSLSDQRRRQLSSQLGWAGIDYPVVDEAAQVETPLPPSFDDPAAAPPGFRRRRSRPGKKDAASYLRVKMSDLEAGMDKIHFVAKVFDVQYQTLRKKGELQKIYVTDYTSAVVLKRFEGVRLSKAEMHEIDVGQVLDVYGSVSYDEYDRMNEVFPDFVEPVEDDPWKRSDDWEGEKHIDLHVHTNRSEMDGVSACQELINRAFGFGQKAIAITDTSVVQAFPLAQSAHFKLDKAHPGNDFKVIYGMEIKMCDDQLTIVRNADDQLLAHAEYCVLDLETTGLSAQYDDIIEFGGVIVRDGVLVDSERLQMFVKPPVSLPPFIVAKTNITNEMLASAPSFEQAADRILAFIGDRVIVAHNAEFDFNFLNEKLIQIGREPLKNVCLDTLNLSKALLNRRYYRLGLIAKNYGVSYDDEVAHRGDYDAEVLARIFVRMLPTIPGYPAITFRQLQEQQAADNYKKAKVYSVNLLAKNMAGIKALYELVTLSHTKYLTYFSKDNNKPDANIVAEPRIVRSEIQARRENLLVGSSNLYGEVVETATDLGPQALKQVMGFYDYIEIQPLENYASLVEEGSSFTPERIRTCILNIVKTADELGKPVVGDADVYYTDPYQKIARDVYIMAKRVGSGHHPLYPLSREKRATYTSPDQHLMTTGEIMKAFAYVGDRAREFVIDNPARIAGQIEKLYPIATKLHTPSIPGCEEKLKEEIYRNAHAIYGDPLPDIVAQRIKKELDSVIGNGFSVQYYIAYLLVKQSNEDGYIVGSRGSVGSSLIATMANITEVNPLPPHYVCPKCRHSEFFTHQEIADGFDLPEKNCPVCGTPMNRDGHAIPFETFLGFHGDKVPDIDLNFSADYQAKAQQLIRQIFGEQNSFRAGTIGTVAKQMAYGYVKGYCEETGRVDGEGKPVFTGAYMDFLAGLCEDVKRTTGQHPGGIVVIPKENDVHDFTPLQYPANNPNADWLTTHFAFKDLHDNILKLDILGHVDPTAVRLLQLYTGVDPKDVPMTDPKTLSLFSSIEALNIQDPDHHWQERNGAAGLPEFGTRNNRNILDKTKPTTFAELVSLSGLTHGTNVWANNAEELIDHQGLTLKDVIACRDDIMTYLVARQLDSKEAFDIMESVRHGRGLTPEWEADMRDHGVPDWYIGSCKLIQYMFPKAHAVAYVMMAVRIAWFKVYYPAEYYAVFFSCRCDAYDLETMIAGEAACYKRLSDIRAKRASGSRGALSNKEEALEVTLEIAVEMYLRGYHLNPLSLERSEAVNFIVDPDDPHGIIPSFNAIDGMGAAAAESIVAARRERPFYSKEDLQKRTLVNNTQLVLMENLGALDGLADEDQMSLF